MATSRVKKPAAAPKKKSAARKAAAPGKKKKASPSAATKYGQRADFGSPIEAFFDKQPAALRPILVELRKLVESTVPEAESSIKWGMPFYSLDGEMMCALGGHKSHVNLVLAGAPGTFDDPKGLLEGDGKTGRRLKLTSLADLPRDSVRSWLKAAARLARSKR